MATKLAPLGDRFVLGERLGASGEAEVFRARDRRRRADVVVKLVAAPDDGARARLLAEFERLAELDHPALPTVIEVGEVDPGSSGTRGVFMALELVDGPSAAEACAALTGEARARRVARALSDGATALEVLHAHGLVHHDVKPAHLIEGPDGGFRLIDLGLARTAGVSDGTARGTLAYLAPDALAGSADPAVDLYALGATGYELLTGAPPYVASDPATLLAAQARPRRVAPGPAALVELIDALLELDPTKRPSAARLVVEELARAGLAEARGLGRGGEARSTGFVATSAGRLATLATLERAVETAGLVALVGPPGSGRSRLILELDRRRALGALRAGRARPRLHGPSLDTAAATLGLEEGDRSGLRGRVVDALVQKDAVLHLEKVDPTELVAWAAALRARVEGGPARLLIELEPAAAETLAQRLGAQLALVEVPPLDEEEGVALGARLFGASVREVATLAQHLARGNPRALIDLARAAQARAARRNESVAPDDLRAVRIDALDHELADALQRLPEGARTLLAALALLGRPATLAELAPVIETPSSALSALGRERLLTWRGDRLALEGATLARAADAAIEPSARAALGRRLLRAADERSAYLDAARLARTLEDATAPHRIATMLRRLLDGSLTERPSLEEALGLASQVPGALGARLSGELLLSAAEYRRAVAMLAEAVAHLPDPDERAEVELLRARALRGAGDPEAAARLAAVLGGSDNIVASRARVLGARLALDRGEAETAAAALVSIVEPDDDWGRREYHEVRGLAALQVGDREGARVAFTALQGALATAPASRRARAEALLGMVAQSEGALDEAAAAYGRALAAAEANADLHAAAIYAQNLGGTLRELGEHERALPALSRAAEVLGRVGRDEERALALYNLGGLHLALGDLDAAEGAAARAERSEHPAARRWAALLWADVARRRDDLDGALARYDALLAERPAAADALVVLAARAELLAEAGHADAEPALLALVRARADETIAPAARGHAALAEARARLAFAAEAALPEPLRQALHELARLAERSARRELALRARILLLRDAVRRGDSHQLATHLDRARAFYEEIRMRTPELRRAALAEDPDVRRLTALLASADRAGADPTPLRRLIEINKRLNSEVDLDRLLELILDTVIELSRAERGFLLLRGTDGNLEIRLERNVDPEARAGAQVFSRSIAERAAAEGEPIVTVDAAGDQRFESALSVVDLRLRSVLAVPLSVKGRVVGAVYVDHRARVGLFKPADVALVADLAEQAAIAVENARLIADNRDKAAQVRALNAALEAELASQRVEIEGMHREVREARRSLGLRYDYAGLIGQTPRMVELFRLLDRVTETALPVVIYGESGTGKELVARAIHHNGPRRKAAFVSESCAAIPETLLEAALFGHVRGAFTGAQGERRGLFEIADGGTLFLDEVGEMSPAMQVRLLRVLQEGEFRRVGGEKQLKVDVRILVASNRDLGRMVEEGSFREDLYYRLNVVRVALPPLRERTADIPLLVEHFLAARPNSPGITRRALERLARYTWPGNVRQLENEIARAGSLADGPIDLPDLSPQVQAGTDAAEVDGPEPLDLHARVERLERGLLGEALSRTGGNQTEAARLLGLSRYGLQKKLRRYRIRATQAKAR